MDLGNGEEMTDLSRFKSEQPQTAAGRALLEHMEEDAAGFVVVTSGRFSIKWVLDALRHEIPKIEAEARQSVELTSSVAVERLLDAANDVAADPELLYWDVDQQWWQLPSGPTAYLKAVAAAYAAATTDEEGARIVEHAPDCSIFGYENRGKGCDCGAGAPQR